MENNNYLEDSQGKNNELEDIKKKETLSQSATTLDNPDFGWSGYAERINGRFAMIGIFAILIIEVFSNKPFLQWANLIN